MRSYCTKCQAINVVVAQEEGRGTSVSWSEPVTPYIHIHTFMYIKLAVVLRRIISPPPKLSTGLFNMIFQSAQWLCDYFHIVTKPLSKAKTEIPRLYDSKKKGRNSHFFIMLNYFFIQLVNQTSDTHLF